MAGVKVHLAKILATAEEPDVRDGDQALRLAEEGRKVIGDQDYRVFDALAAAYAASGRYDEACRAARQAIELAKIAGAREAVRDLESRLQRYRSQTVSGVARGTSQIAEATRNERRP